MALSRKARLKKLRTLAKIEGYDAVEDMLGDAVRDAVSPAICINDDCHYTAEMEPDQDRGWCDECRTNSVAAALVLAGLI